MNRPDKARQEGLPGGVQDEAASASLNCRHSVGPAGSAQPSAAAPSQPPAQSPTPSPPAPAREEPEFADEGDNIPTTQDPDPVPLPPQLPPER